MCWSTVMNWGAALFSRATGDAAVWIIVVRHWGVSGALSALSLLFGPVSISGGLPPAAQGSAGGVYRLWFPATHPLAASRQPYPASLPDVLAQFGGVDYVDDLTKLKSLLGNLGCGIPPLYKQYSELLRTGGVQFIDFGSDPTIQRLRRRTGMDLCYLKANRYQRYIEAHL
jgi:hypothetical protein